MLVVPNRNKLTENLTKFYDFKGKAVLYVGAGGGQLLGPASGASKVVAVDSDAESLVGFRSEAKTKWAGIPVRFVPRSFETVNLTGDVVYFEFCLHEMPDPRKALEHASSLAPDIVVIDHLPKSKWVFYAAEETQVLRGTNAAVSFGIRRRERFTVVQKFNDYEELRARMSEQGVVSRQRVLALKGAKDIRIRMDYGLYLL
jgi:predicted RNA methylase